MTRTDALAFLSFPDFLLGLPAGPASAGGNGTPLSNVFLELSSAIAPAVGCALDRGPFFAVDDWTISPALTINLGFRLEANGQQSEAQGQISNFYPEFYVSPPRGWIYEPQHIRIRACQTITKGLRRKGFRARTPRLSMTQFNASHSHASAWRGGLLIARHRHQKRLWHVREPRQLSWIQHPPGLQSPLPSHQEPGRRRQRRVQLAASVSHTAAGFVLPELRGATLPGPPYIGDRTPQPGNIIDPDFKDATIQQYGLEIQYQRDSYLFSLAYAGARGTHLAVSRSNNQPALATPTNPVNGLTTNSVANAAERVPFPGLAPLLFRVESTGTSDYNSLQATINKRLSHGLQFLAAYTLSKVN